MDGWHFIHKVVYPIIALLHQTLDGCAVSINENLIDGSPSPNYSGAQQLYLTGDEQEAVVQILSLSWVV